MRSILVILCILAACGCTANQRLGVKLDQPTYWRSPNGERFVARHGWLSDDSLSFVKVTMPDGRQWTLPRASAASGVRYTDEHTLVWWEHQDWCGGNIRARCVWMSDVTMESGRRGVGNYGPIRRYTNLPKKPWMATPTSFFFL